MDYGNAAPGRPARSVSELFAGTAWYYSRYRAPYPDKLFDLITSRFGLDGLGRLLDVGCGTGEIAIPMRKMFEEVLALDASTEMIEEARRNHQRGKGANIRWLVMPAEEVSPELGSFRLVTFGSALHWMNRDLVLQRCREILVDDGGIATFGMSSIWGGTATWERAVVEVIQRWLGEKRQHGSFAEDPRRHEDVLADSAFVRLEIGALRSRSTWDIPFINGHLYSTSYCNRALLGDDIAAFEDDLRQTLLAIDGSGRFVREVVVNYIFAWKR